MQRIVLGDVTSIDVPDSLRAAIDHDGTVIATLPGTEYPEIRISLLTLHKAEMPPEGAGTKFVTEKARQSGASLNTHGLTVWCELVQAESTRSAADTLRTWLAGMGPHVLIATLDLGPISSASSAGSVLAACISQIIQSFTSVTASTDAPPQS